MSNYIPEEQEGQVYTSEQEAPNQELAGDEKEFDPNHPPVPQPKNPTPAQTSPKVIEHQVQQVETSEQDVPGKNVHDANPSDI